ncbi:hypothetical protein C2G38_2263229 [Gigaspora rosea]|uniref:HCP-like protein n=1 Tax=Gigaspora rosea TaxID=44941 RepID=A0A397VYI2_9GLOM|nr:hypothetical protein C2G38_2263229 [Gigaspora rosea]
MVVESEDSLLLQTKKKKIQILKLFQHEKRKKIGLCYENGVGVEKDEHKAFIYYQKSAEMGYVNGIHDIGYCYLYGVGVEKDEHKAFFYFQKSAEMGNAMEQIVLNIVICLELELK